MNLKGKTVLVTGAAKRVGREIALCFARAGAHVLVHYRSSKKEAERLVEEIRSLKVKCYLFQADLSKISEIKRMTAAIRKKIGTVDILVNSASLFYRTKFEATTERDWDDFVAIHLKAPFFLAQFLAPAMKKKGGGRIINIADWSGLRPYRDYLPYCVSKGGVITMTQALAKTLAPEVLVTAVCPGPVFPPPDLTQREKEDVARKTLVGHWGKPEDVARMVVFLAESDFITGSYHLVDGGEILRG